MMVALKLKIENWPIDKVFAYAKNARLHSDEQIAAVAVSIREFGFVNPCLVDAEGMLIAGHCRILSAKQIGMKTVPVIRLGHLTKLQVRALRIADNALPLQATWDIPLITAELQGLKLSGYNINILGFGQSELVQFSTTPGPDGGAPATGLGSLAERFGVVPFSVLNAREGWWQDRKRAWLALGIQSELGRGENLLKFSDTLLEPDPEKRKQRA